MNKYPPLTIIIDVHEYRLKKTYTSKKDNILNHCYQCIDRNCPVSIRFMDQNLKIFTKNPYDILPIFFDNGKTHFCKDLTGILIILLFRNIKQHKNCNEYF